MKNDARVNLKIEEPEGSERAPREGVSAAPSAPYVRDTTVEDVIRDLKAE